MDDIANIVDLGFRVLFRSFDIQIFEREFVTRTLLAVAIRGLLVLVRHVGQEALASRTFQPNHTLTASLLDHFHIEVVFAYGTVLVDYIRLCSWHRCSPDSKRPESCNMLHSVLSCGTSFHRVCMCTSHPNDHPSPLAAKAERTLHILYLWSTSSLFRAYP